MIVRCSIVDEMPRLKNLEEAENTMSRYLQTPGGEIESISTVCVMRVTSDYTRT